jgi:hypothetical protein
MTPDAKKRLKKVASGKKRQKKRRLKPLSLHPLDFETAIKAFVTVGVKKPKV